ncbi:MULTISPECIES: VOC family protein [Pseudoalteromonas]|uniref:VOC family protein n=1 Tax=Pseudoalteromonas qingdaonensis TaxID=3131913 RepID=A0ABU9MU13_9GAMM
MNTSAPPLRGIHHCHLQVDDVVKAKAFYQEVMGFDVVPELEFWYYEQEDGPLMLQDQARSICLALFEGGKRSNGIAFNTDAAAFVHWRSHLQKHGVTVHLADHQVSFSMYFRDPYNNMHEITCFEYSALKAQL